MDELVNFLVTKTSWLLLLGRVHTTEKRIFSQEPDGSGLSPCPFCQKTFDRLPNLSSFILYVYKMETHGSLLLFEDIGKD